MCVCACVCEQTCNVSFGLSDTLGSLIFLFFFLPSHVCYLLGVSLIVFMSMCFLRLEKPAVF